MSVVQSNLHLVRAVNVKEGENTQAIKIADYIQNSE